MYTRDVPAAEGILHGSTNPEGDKNSQGALILANRAEPKPGGIQFARFDSLSVRLRGTAEEGHPCFTEEMALVWVHPNSVHYRLLSSDLAEPPTTTTTTHRHKSFNVDIQRD